MVAISKQAVSDEIRRQQRLSTSIVDLQTQISTGTRVNKASDSPQNWVEISEIGRAQAQQTTWTSNISYAQYRAASADTAMGEINTLLTRAQELMTSAGSIVNDANRQAIASELEGIKTSIDGLLSQNDALGTPLFDTGVATKIPVGTNMAVEAVPTVSSLTTNIDVNGTPQTLDALFAAAQAALSSGDEADRQTALVGFQAAGDHVNFAQTIQGQRASRIDALADSLASDKVALSERLATVRDTDLTEAIATLQSQQLSLSAAQATYAKISQQTLFDLISG